ncbi:DUF2859 domain-containing protein, partial [Escherichia coli]|uniref:DUF2859 domain-containing protein n=1 Tax=Escherichia coli TaxID=562 RepID=UPI000AFA185E
MNRLKRIIPFTFPVWLLFSATVSAELTVIADLGGRDAAPFFEGINRQAPASAPVVSPPPLLQGEAAMLPVSTPEMSPGEVTPRPLQLPGIGALFLVGDDACRLYPSDAPAVGVSGVARIPSKSYIYA